MGRFPSRPRRFTLRAIMLRYRVANPAPAVWNVLKTVVVVALFSGIFAWVLPTVVVRLQRESGDFDALFFPQQILIGRVVFAIATVIVVWSALTLAIKGGGTPLSFDAPRRMVITGPYAWMRTPMVSGTVFQGIGFGLMSGSIVVVVLFLIFALCWNTLIRPHEEDQLQHLFGRAFEAYRRNVRCWLPLRTPWKPLDEFGPIRIEDPPDTGETRRRRRTRRR